MAFTVTTRVRKSSAQLGGITPNYQLGGKRFIIRPSNTVTEGHSLFYSLDRGESWYELVNYIATFGVPCPELIIDCPLGMIWLAGNEDSAWSCWEVPESANPFYNNHYSEDDYTPVEDNVSLATANGHYVKHGSICNVSMILIYPVTADANVSRVTLPFTDKVIISATSVQGLTISYTHLGSTINCGIQYGTGKIRFSMINGVHLTNANLSGNTIYLTGSYVTV